jgi:hypothetical protein
MQKIKQAEKYAGQRNKTKRGNIKFITTAAAAASVGGPFVVVCAVAF